MVEVVEVVVVEVLVRLLLGGGDGGGGGGEGDDRGDVVCGDGGKVVEGEVEVVVKEKLMEVEKVVDVGMAVVVLCWYC